MPPPSIRARAHTHAFLHASPSRKRVTASGAACSEEHADLAAFLRHVGGFDSVDDESASEVPFETCGGTPADAWTRPDNPAYAWQL